MFLGLITLLTACEKPKHASQEVGKIVAWNSPNNAREELVLISGTDYVVTYHLNTGDKTPKSQRFNITYSGLHSMSCSAPYLDESLRSALFKLTRGGKELVSLEGPRGIEVLEGVGYKTRKIYPNQSARQVRVIVRLYEDKTFSESFLDKRTNAVIGWRNRALSASGHIQHIRNAPSIDPALKIYARENCDPGPMRSSAP